MVSRVKAQFVFSKHQIPVSGPAPSYDIILFNGLPLLHFWTVT